MRAVLGQQVSVAGAATVAGRLAAELGEPLETPLGGVTRLFPSTAALASADPEALPMPRSRARALAGLAAAIEAGELELDPGADRADTERRLLALPGIGPWTAAYVAMRALRDPDAFLPTDLGVRHALERLGRDGSPRGRERGGGGLAPLPRLRDPAPVGAAGMSARIRIDTPLGPLVAVAAGDGGLRSLAFDDEERPRARARARRARRHAPPALRVLRGRADDLRAAAERRRHAVPAARLAGARRDPLRRDDQLRRAGRGASERRTRRARSGSRTAAIRFRSWCPATA